MRVSLFESPGLVECMLFAKWLE